MIMGLYCFLGFMQHDGNHGTVSRKPWVNRVVGYIQNWIGGSANVWIHNHNEHHIHTNSIHQDPDMITPNSIRLVCKVNKVIM